MTTVKLGGVTVSSYTFDSNSNRTSVTKGGVTTNATFTNYDQLIAFGTKSYTYNSNGELTQIVDSSSMPSGVFSFTYDTFGNLKTVTLPNSDVIEYLLDAGFRRVGVKLNGNLIKQYIWRDQLKLAAELDGSGTLVAEYIYGTRVNVPDYIKRGSDLYKVMRNHLGSVVAVVDSSTGSVVQEIKYDELGKVTSDTNPGFQPFGYAGGMYDSDTQLVHFNAREYNPDTGAWLSKDSILFAGGDPNLYGYVLQDPVNSRDPKGQKIALPIVAVIIGLAILAYEYNRFKKTDPTSGESFTEYLNRMYNPFYDLERFDNTGDGDSSGGACTPANGWH